MAGLPHRSFFFPHGLRARMRTVPLRWIWLGIILTVLDSWNADWVWVAPNILFQSFAAIRVVAPSRGEPRVEQYGLTAFVVLVCGLVAVLPLAAKCVEYGAEGWLWAMFGLCQRRYVDERPAARLASAPSPGSASQPSVASRRQERFSRSPRQVRARAGRMHTDEFEPDPDRRMRCRRSRLPLAGTSGILVLSDSIRCLHAGTRCSVSLSVRVSPWTEPSATAGEHGEEFVRFIGRHTLEIYAIQLAGSELLVGLLPHRAP